jgi:hypothetical protein
MIVLAIKLIVAVLAVAALLLYAAAWVQRWRVKRQIKVKVVPIRLPKDAA